MPGAASLVLDLLALPALQVVRRDGHRGDSILTARCSTYAMPPSTTNATSSLSTTTPCGSNHPAARHGSRAAGPPWRRLSLRHRRDDGHGADHVEVEVEDGPEEHGHRAGQDQPPRARQLVREQGRLQRQEADAGAAGRLQDGEGRERRVGARDVIAGTCGSRRRSTPRRRRRRWRP